MQEEAERQAQLPSAGEASTSGSGASQAPSSAGARVQNSDWAHLLLELPLELAAVGARTNERWLRKRKRSHWWSKGPFPKVSLGVGGLGASGGQRWRHWAESVWLGSVAGASRCGGTHQRALAAETQPQTLVVQGALPQGRPQVVLVLLGVLGRYQVNSVWL